MLDEGESSEVDIQDDIEFALIQMKAETLNKIDTALGHSADGTTAAVSSAAARLPKHAFGPFRSRCAQELVRKLMRRPEHA